MFQILVFKPNILLLLLLETSQNCPILKFSRVMRYEYVLFNSKRVYYFIKNCELQRASISKFCQYIFLKRTSFSDYAVLQVFSSFFFFEKTTYCCRARRLSVRPSVRPSVRLSVRLSVRPSVVCGNNFFSR